MNQIFEKIDNIKKIVEVLLNNMGTDGLSRISQIKIANK